MLVQVTKGGIDITCKEDHEYALEQVPNEIGGRTFLGQSPQRVTVTIKVNDLIKINRLNRRIAGTITGTYFVGEHTTEQVHADLQAKFQALLDKAA